MVTFDGRSVLALTTHGSAFSSPHCSVERPRASGIWGRGWAQARSASVALGEMQAGYDRLLAQERYASVWILSHTPDDCVVCERMVSARAGCEPALAGGGCRCARRCATAGSVRRNICRSCWSCTKPTKRTARTRRLNRHRPNVPPPDCHETRERAHTPQPTLSVLSHEAYS
jgi:hypothetical protein